MISKIGRNSCAQLMEHGVSDVLEPPAGRDPMRHIIHQKTKSLMADKRLTNSIDDVPPNSHISSQRASLFVFGDNDDVIKMIIKGQSPSIRTHRVNMDWFFDRINWILESRANLSAPPSKSLDQRTRGPCLLDRGGLSSVGAVKRRRSSCWEFLVAT